MSVYAYGRVSSKDQNWDRQKEAFLKIPVPEENIYLDKQSGKNFVRARYQTMLRKLKKDDVLYIHSINRLGRNYEEILEQWKYLTKKKKVDIVVLDMPILDTRYARDLLGTFVADIVLYILSYVAEQTRHDIKIAQAEGISVAKKNGVVFGRPKSLDIDYFRNEYLKMEGKGYTDAEMISVLGISTSTFYRYKRIMDCA